MVLNTAGYVQAHDFGTPKLLTGVAREAISGGEHVFASGATAVISSGINSYGASDIELATGASGLQFNGVALGNAESGAKVSFALDGVFISTAAGTINAGQPVAANGGHALVGLLSGSAAGTQVGRALVSAGSEGFVLWNLGQC